MIWNYMQLYANHMKLYTIIVSSFHKVFKIMQNYTNNLWNYRPVKGASKSWINQLLTFYQGVHINLELFHFTCKILNFTASNNEFAKKNLLSLLLGHLVLFVFIPGLDGTRRHIFECNRSVRIILFLPFVLSRTRCWGWTRFLSRHFRDECGQEDCFQRHQVGPEWTGKLRQLAPEKLPIFQPFLQLKKHVTISNWELTP